ncbi:MAG TPA: M28 family peptidase [Tepidisphaeraceae bacterium]|jgi:hypothetical protein
MTDDRRERLRRHVDVLAEIIGERHTGRPANLDAARRYIADQLVEMGYDVHRQAFPVSGREGVNLSVTLSSQKPRRSVLIIGAHYDTVRGTPGADGNASAVAMLLEIARHLAGKTPARDVELVFYDCEEPPHFATGDMGSQDHARRLRRSGRKVFGMICLESVGYFVKNLSPQPLPWPLNKIVRWLGGRNIIIVSDLASFRFGTRFVWSFLRSGRFPFLPAALPRRISEIGLSDHRSYWEQGYPALMVTNTAFLRNPNYHRSSDRLATLDLERMTHLCEQLCKAVQKFAGAR